jgi:mono/diheme cytochrome c family protein
VPDFAQAEVPVPADTVTAGDYTVSVTVSPGGPGINTFDTRITDRDGRPVDAISVSAQHVLPVDDRRSPREVLENIEGALYVTANDSLDVPGTWWTLLDIQTPQGDLTRAAFVWDIRPEASIIESRPPGLLTLAALAATLAAAVWAISPGLKRFYAKQDINPLTVSVALWATAATIVFAIAGYVIVTDTQNTYRAILNPTPEIVNDVLPDGDSLARGASLFAESCAGWEGAPLDELRQRLPRTRDAELFAFTRDGWRGLPACADVAAADRWDLVNYVRTFEPGVSVSASD